MEKIEVEINEKPQKKTENIQEYRKKYYREHKDELTEKKKITKHCELCNKEIQTTYISKHFKTQKHKNNVLENNFNKLMDIIKDRLKTE